VRPPSVIPAPDSIKAIISKQPKSEPIDIVITLQQYASVERRKSPIPGSTTPEKRAIE